ncbi:hypothetical protein [Vibrio parahaemolyticus]|uniref:hypothetical protein n=1 Tax=Vibrio parahaemolyticus TaxID=670 RepID=UPI002119C4D4|nr:hypothetical protein [Vibrio parahaemolyticus]MCQ9094439.1 hypothetical protein [Vibrio parahaemolyticus]
MNFEYFFNTVESKDLRIDCSDSNSESLGLLDNEALFQLPFISLVILLLAKDRRKPKVSELGRLVGEAIEVSMPAFKQSKQKIGWSANLRIRTINAMTFLESCNLVHVNNRMGKIEATDKGKKLINVTLKNDNNLSYNLSIIGKSYRNICVSRQLDLEL